MSRDVGTILILHYQMPLGCCVHATPLFAAIKAAAPGVRLLVATRALGADVFRHDPHIDSLIETPDPRPSFAALRATAKALRSRLSNDGETVGLVLQPATDRAGSFAMLSLLLRLAPAAGFANAPQLYDTHLAYDDQRSLIDNNLRLVHLLGQPSAHLEPAVYFTLAELSAAQTMLLESDPQARPVCAFVMQGSGGQRTGWHEDRFAAVIRYVEAKGFATIFLGTAGDAPRIDAMLQLAASHGASLAGRTSIPELAALLTQCDLLVSIDTGTMHVGRAAGLPMVVLGPSWQHPIEWLPLSVENARVLRGEDRSDIPMNYQLDEIEVPDVIAAIEDLIATYPPSEAARSARAARLVSEARP